MWALLQVVMLCIQFLSLENIKLTSFPLSYCACKTEPPPQPSAPAVLTADPYTPTSALTPAMLAASHTLSELGMVRQWLHDTTPLGCVDRLLALQKASHDSGSVLRHGRDVHPTWVKSSIETLSNTRVWGSGVQGQSPKRTLTVTDDEWLTT